MIVRTTLALLGTLAGAVAQPPAEPGPKNELEQTLEGVHTTVPARMRSP